DTTERAIGQLARRLPPRVVEPGPDHGIQFRIDRLDPLDSRLGQLPGTYLTATDKIRLRGGIQPHCLTHIANATQVPGGAVGGKSRRARRGKHVAWPLPGCRTSLTSSLRVSASPPTSSRLRCTAIRRWTP